MGLDLEELVESAGDKLEEKIKSEHARVVYKLFSFFTSAIRDPFDYSMGVFEGGMESITKDFRIASSVREIVSDIRKELTDRANKKYDVEEAGRISALISSHISTLSFIVYSALDAAYAKDTKELGWEHIGAGVLLAFNIYSAVSELRKSRYQNKGI
ncbi:MAG TPA: hypothetical protein VI564_03590 [Candidatus Nanoarchaeia archaeon]|nr:hypothetical protein [Candidatus Nanoarchaeia archaeon]